MIAVSSPLTRRRTTTLSAIDTSLLYGLGAGIHRPDDADWDVGRDEPKAGTANDGASPHASRAWRAMRAFETSLDRSSHAQDASSVRWIPALQGKAAKLNLEQPRSRPKRGLDHP